MGYGKKTCKPYSWGGITVEEKVEICGKPDSDYILLNYSASEAIAKIKEYEAKQNDEIRVGDEVLYDKRSNVVIEVLGNIVSLMSGKGYVYTASAHALKKTGRHFSQIDDVLKQMQEDKE